MDMRQWRLIATAFVTVVILAGGGVLYVNHAVTEQTRVECDVYTQLDSAYKAAPPTTQTGRQFAAAVHKVVLKYGCEE